MTDATATKGAAGEAAGPIPTTLAFSPRRRAWVATALMEALFGLLFISSLYLALYLNSTQPGPSGPFASWGTVAVDVPVLYRYALVLVLVHFTIVAVIIPMAVRTVGRDLARLTRAWNPVASAVAFAGVAAVPALIVAAPFFMNGGIGPMIAFNLGLLPALAAVGTRLLLPVALRVKAVQWTAIVVAVLVVAYPVVQVVRLLVAVIRHLF
ncbi:MAG: hypothetical protein CVT64_07840 [Actinobacteria bacterium HGW-Actinobacteria-4]|nr:MAG: hypothetical protein CVT64_07840 [Actinobacteria bacterium HGW-Actinobacteria-4]